MLVLRSKSIQSGNRSGKPRTPRNTLEERVLEDRCESGLRANREEIKYFLTDVLPRLKVFGK